MMRPLELLGNARIAIDRANRLVLVLTPSAYDALRVDIESIQGAAENSHSHISQDGVFSWIVTQRYYDGILYQRGNP